MQFKGRTRYVYEDFSWGTTGRGASDQHVFLFTRHDRYRYAGEIRKSSKQDFEQIDRFQQLYETGTLKSPDEVARILLDLLAGDPAGGCVYDAREYGKKQS